MLTLLTVLTFVSSFTLAYLIVTSDPLPKTRAGFFSMKAYHNFGGCYYKGFKTDKPVLITCVTDTAFNHHTKWDDIIFVGYVTEFIREDRDHADYMGKMDLLPSSTYFPTFMEEFSDEEPISNTFRGVTHDYLVNNGEDQRCFSGNA